WWMETAALYVTDVTGSGTVATGWPASGRSLGTLPSNRHRPAAVADGTGGIYVGWLALTGEPTEVIHAVHLGPNAASKGGWSILGRTFGAEGDITRSGQSFGMDVAPAGGRWLAWDSFHFVGGAAQPGDVRVLRVTTAGRPAASWSADGVSLAPFDPSFLGDINALLALGQGFAAVAGDGGGGAYVVAGLAADV